MRRSPAMTQSVVTELIESENGGIATAGGKAQFDSTGSSMS